jgi:diaminopimelate epimerase
MTLPFIKMNGTGNDFVVVDLRALAAEEASRVFRSLSAEAIRSIAARDNPVTKGCDQLVVLEHGHNRADVFMHIYNADGGEVSACGNATRCVGHLLLEESKKTTVRVGTKVDVLTCERASGGVTVDMGMPRFANVEIPIAEGIDGAHVPVAYCDLQDGMAVGMGNPHVVYFVADVNTKDLESFGPTIEQRHLEVFPERVNVNVGQIIDSTRIRLRTWERGVGLTLACGTGACATLVAASQRGLTGRKADIVMQGGTLTIDWRDDGHVWMTGPVELEFNARLSV